MKSKCAARLCRLFLKNKSSPLRQSARGSKGKSAEASSVRLEGQRGGLGRANHAAPILPKRRRRVKETGQLRAAPPEASGGSTWGAEKGMKKAANASPPGNPTPRPGAGRRLIECQNHLNRLLALGLLASAARAASSWAMDSRCLTIFSKAELSSSSVKGL